MTLSKEQIVFIDDYLKSKQLKYWDIRLEMVDHLASKLEQEPNLILNEALLKQEFGDLFQVKKIAQLRALDLKRKYRKLLINEVTYFFGSFKNMFLFVLLYLFEIVLFKHLDIRLFNNINVITMFISLIVPVFYTIRSIVKKNKSKNLELAISYATISFTFLNIIHFFILFNFKINHPLVIPIFLLVFIPFHLLLVYCGMKNYNKVYKEYQNLFNEQRKINATH